MTPKHKQQEIKTKYVGIFKDSKIIENKQKYKF